MLRRMEKRVARLERRGAKLERENKALRAGQAALIEAMGQMSSAFAQGGVAPAAVEDGAARRPPLRQRLVGRHRPHRLPRARAAVRVKRHRDKRLCSEFG